MEKVRTILEKDLKENVVPFWNNMVDKEFGGFYGAVDMEHQIISIQLKTLIIIMQTLEHTVETLLMVELMVRMIHQAHLNLAQYMVTGVPQLATMRDIIHSQILVVAN